MTHFLLTAALLAIAVSVVWAQGDSLKGKRWFERRCVACHGSGGKGDGPMGKLLAPPAADLTAERTQKRSDTELGGIIRNGKQGTAMPAFKGQLGDEAILHLVAYLRLLRGQAARAEAAATKPVPPVHVPVTPSAATVTIPFNPPSIEDAPPGPEGDAIRLGYEVIINTRQHLGRNVGNGLDCRNCHLGAGRVAQAGPFVGVYAAAPEYRSRSARVTTLEMRINECMQRSMNGKPLLHDGPEMSALVSYFAWLSKGIPSGAKIPERGFPSVTPTRGADRKNGRALFSARCAVCHGPDGHGTRNGPPVWGPQSFNIGAGMARRSKAAAFIKKNMPLGMGGMLTDDEANDLAAFITSQPRPDFPPKANDWPKGGKPADVPY